METLSEIRPGGFEFRTRCIGLKPDFFIANGDVIYADSRCAEHELLNWIEPTCATCRWSPRMCTMQARCLFFELISGPLSAETDSSFPADCNTFYPRLGKGSGVLAIHRQVLSTGCGSLPRRTWTARVRCCRTRPSSSWSVVKLLAFSRNLSGYQQEMAGLTGACAGCPGDHDREVTEVGGQGRRHAGACICLAGIVHALMQLSLFQL